jgi:1-acyl-sn-glycerol-3-phosphate acyltransferase
MAKESLFRVPGARLAAARDGHDPGGPRVVAAAKQTIVQAEELAEHGRGVIVYPEGSLTRDPDLWPMRGKTGAVRLALAGIPVIPMATWGVQRILPRYGKLSLWPPRKRVRVARRPGVDLDTYRSGPARTRTSSRRPTPSWRTSRGCWRICAVSPPRRAVEPGRARTERDRAP